MKLKTVMQSMRIPFLALTVVCVFLGASTVVANGGTVDFSLLALALLGALLAHVSVNTLNEYFDFKSGLDFKTLKTPFSGGSGALPQNPEMATTVLNISIASSLALLLIGSFFVWHLGAGIVPIGITGLLLIATYTSWVNRHPLICLFAPGLGFGFLMVAGTQFVLQGQYTALAWQLGVIPFFLVNNLLLLNQYPDIRADTEAGRYHFPIAYGIQRSNLVYGFFALLTGLLIIAYVLTGLLPTNGLLALLPMPLAFFALYGAVKHGEAVGNFPQYLAAGVAVAILTTLLLGVSLIL